MSGEIKKAVRWYKKMAVWKVILAVLADIASGETFAYFKDISLPIWAHSVMGGAGVILVLIRTTGLIKDENGDGIVD